MIDNILVEDLAVTPPSLWPQRIRRFEVLKHIAANKKPAAQNIEESAAQLNLGRRQFYALLASYRQRLAGGSATGPRTGCRYSIDALKEALIDEALDRAGPAARLVQVCAEAQRLANQRGIEAPSQTSIRTRFGKAQHNVDLRRRLATRRDWLADTVALDLLVDGPVGPISANLFAIVDTYSGAIVFHQLFAGRPSIDEIASSLTVFAGQDEGSAAPREVGVVDSLFDQIHDLHAEINWRAVRGSLTRVLSDGTVIRAACGSKLGRIALRERKTTMCGQDMVTVPLDHAQAVVALVISQRNASLKRLPLVRQRRHKSPLDFTGYRFEQQLQGLGNAAQLVAGH